MKQHKFWIDRKLIHALTAEQLKVFAQATEIKVEKLLDIDTFYTTDPNEIQVLLTGLALSVGSKEQKE